MLIYHLANQYHLIIVTPDGGATSYNFNSSLDKMYETCISKKLVEKIDGTYRLVKADKRSIILNPCSSTN